MDYTLPNGVVIQGIPEGTSEEDIMRYAQHNGLLGQMDAQEVASQPVDTSFLDDVQQAAVDLLPEAGGMAGAVAGAKLGAASGSLFGPAGAAGGALIGSAIGAFSFSGAAESLRQLIEKEDPDALKAVEVAATEGTFDVIGGRAFDILSAGKEIIKRGMGYGERQVDEVMVELQQKLQTRGGTLRGSQVDPNARILGGFEAAAQEAIGSKDYLGMLDNINIKYLDEQIAAVTRVSDDLEGEQLGILIKNLVENTRGANAEMYGQLFSDLQKKGAGVKVSLQGPRNMAAAWKKQKMDGLTRAMQQAIQRGANIPFTSGQVNKAVKDILTLSPNSNFSVAFDKLKDLKSKLTALKGDPATANDPAVAEIANIVKGFEESILKSLKKQQAQARNLGDTEQADKIKDVLDTYTSLMAKYTESQAIAYSDVAVKIMREGNPEMIGRTLADAGKVTPVKEVRKIITEAKKRGQGAQGDRIIEGIRQGFMQQHLSAPEGGAALDVIRNFEKKLSQPDFRRTFNELFPPADRKRIEQLIREAEILSRGVGGEFSLAVRSAQLAGAQGLATGGGNAGIIANAVKLMTPGFMAKAAANPDLAKQMLGTIKLARKYMNNPEDMPPQVYRALSLMLGKLSVTMAMDAAEAKDEAFDAQRGPELTQSLENFM